MAALKLLNLLALTSLALLACSFNASPANALSLEGHGLRHVARSHSAILKKKKRQTTCRPRISTPPPADQGPAPSAAPAPAPAPAPAQAAPPPPAPPSGGGGGGKAGIATDTNDPNLIRNCKTWKTGYIYTWSAYVPDVARDLGIPGAPMLWGDKSLGDWHMVTPGYAPVAIGFNEPNEPSQSNMSPGHAIELWWAYMEPLVASGYRLISPACTNGDSGKNWMNAFMAGCSNCHIDAVATHYYGTNSHDFITHIEDIHSSFGRNVWVTEYACHNFGGGAQCSRDEVFTFLRETTGYMDGQVWVEQYFWFGVLYNMANVNYDNQLIDGGGYPNDLGRTYFGF